MPQLHGKTSILRRLMSGLNVPLTRLDQSSYGGHSFRRGAATWGSKVGLSNSEIKLLGYWSSDCFSRYVDSDVDQSCKIKRKAFKNTVYVKQD
jgi:hypothetical protein